MSLSLYKTLSLFNKLVQFSCFSWPPILLLMFIDSGCFMSCLWNEHKDALFLSCTWMLRQTLNWHQKAKQSAGRWNMKRMKNEQAIEGKKDRDQLSNQRLSVCTLCVFHSFQILSPVSCLQLVPLLHWIQRMTLMCLCVFSYVKQSSQLPSGWCVTVVRKKRESELGMGWEEKREEERGSWDRNVGRRGSCDRIKKRRQILESKHRKQSNQQMLSPSLDSFYSKKSTSVLESSNHWNGFSHVFERFRSSLSTMYSSRMYVSRSLFSEWSGDQRSNRTA